MTQQARNFVMEVAVNRPPPLVTGETEIACQERLGGLLKHDHRQAACSRRWIGDWVTCDGDRGAAGLRRTLSGRNGLGIAQPVQVQPRQFATERLPRMPLPAGQLPVSEFVTIHEEAAETANLNKQLRL